ncbi:MAG: hypothetical protein RL700_198 [Pseudomonadota bacterium]
MKKSLVALATLAAATGAFAQSPNARAITGSNVEIFGVMDMAVTRVSASNGGSFTIMDGVGRNESTRLGFRGVEDMGGGWGAGFWLEAGLNIDNGTGANTTINNTANGDRVAFNQTSSPTMPTATLGARQGITFNRASTVSLIGKDVGEIRLGRDYAATFWNYTTYDPFGTVGVGSALNVIGSPLAPLGTQAFPPGAAYPMVRTSNAISWLSNNMNGFRAQIQYALAEQGTDCVTPSTAVNANTCWGASGDGKLAGFRLQYNNGPLSAALANTKTSYGNVAAATAPTAAVTGGTAGTGAVAASDLGNTAAIRGDYTVTNLGAAYTMGATKLMVQSHSQIQAASGAASEKKLTGTLLGVAHTMGALTLKLSVNNAKRGDGSTLVTGAAASSNENGSKISQNAVGFVYDLSKRTALYGTYAKSTTTAGAASGGALRSTLVWNGPAIAAGQSNSSTGMDIGIRHRF